MTINEELTKLEAQKELLEELLNEEVIDNEIFAFFKLKDKHKAYLH